MKNIYSSTALILPPQQDSNVGLMMGILSGGTGGTGISELLGGKNPAEMYVSILKSDVISDAIIDKFKLMELYKKKYRNDTYAALQKNVEISSGKKDGIIYITVFNKDPKLASDIANAYVDELEKLNIRINSNEANKNKVYLEKRVNKAKSDLNASEEKLRLFQIKYKTISISDQAKASIEGVAQLRAQLAIKEIELSSLRRQFTDSSQEVLNLKEVLSNIKKQIALLENSGGSKSSTLPNISNVPDIGGEYMRIVRDVKSNEVLLETLTKQLELAKFTEAKDVLNLQIIQKARVPDKKTKPKRSNIVLISSFAGCLFTIIYLLMFKYNDGMQDDDRRRWNSIKSAVLTSPFK